MAIDPIELQQRKIPRRLFGYGRKAVDELLEQTGTGWELTRRERSDLGARVHQLQADLARHVELEGLLRSTLISAERAAQAHRERAHQEADAILDEAHAKAREVARQVREDTERLRIATREAMSLLRSSLAAMEGASALVSEQPSTEQSAERPASDPGLRDPGELGVLKQLAG